MITVKAAALTVFAGFMALGASSVAIACPEGQSSVCVPWTTTCVCAPNIPTGCNGRGPDCSHPRLHDIHARSIEPKNGQTSALVQVCYWKDGKEGDEKTKAATACKTSTVVVDGAVESK